MKDSILGNDQLAALFLNVQFGPPDDEHLLLETRRGVNKYIKKECVKLVVTQNRIEMHGQQNTKKN
jgi:hypothetical protein